MERFEQIPNYSNTYFQLLPSELRKLLASYVYNCNFIIRGDRDGIGVKLNDIELILPFSSDVVEQIPQLLAWIKTNRPIMINGNHEHIIYTTYSIILTSGSFRITLPICKELVEILGKST